MHTVPDSDTVMVPLLRLAAGRLPQATFDLNSAPHPALLRTCKGGGLPHSSHERAAATLAGLGDLDRHVFLPHVLVCAARVHFRQRLVRGAAVDDDLLASGDLDGARVVLQRAEASNGRELLRLGLLVVGELDEVPPRVGHLERVDAQRAARRYVDDERAVQLERANRDVLPAHHQRRALRDRDGGGRGQLRLEQAEARRKVGLQRHHRPQRHLHASEGSRQRRRGGGAQPSQRAAVHVIDGHL
mmetsp:Transcript_6289/g.16528  ORF Transcript_6289/g.16528 Transcript_6289/m.16528 type:complete len:244 (+) Transcript_6289:64-795(+)